MTKPTVSVVIPVKNGAETISESIKSVQDQSRPADEIVVVVGRSQDDTAAVVSATAGIRVVHQGEPGIVPGFNQGITAARGDFIAFNGADDIWLPKKLESQLRYFEDCPDLQVVTCHMSYFLHDPDHVPPGFRLELLDRIHPAHNCETMLARREIFQTVGLFDPKLTAAFDVDWFSRFDDMKLARACDAGHHVEKRVHDDAASFEPNNRVSTELLSVVAASLARKRAA